MDGVGTGQEVRDQGVPRLVVGDRALLALADDHGAPLDAHQDLVLGVLEVGHLDELLVLSRGQEGGLVHEVREVGPRKAGSAPRQYLQLDVRRVRDPARVDPEDLLPTLHVRPRHDDLAVEAARPKQGRVEHVGPVGRRDQDDAVVGLEAVHLDQELVSVCSRSSCPPPSPAPRRRPTASISSMKMIQGACFLPCSNRSRTRKAPTPTNISTKSDPEMEKKGAFASPAIALARSVLPVPGWADQEDALRDLPRRASGTSGDPAGTR